MTAPLHPAIAAALEPFTSKLPARPLPPATSFGSALDYLRSRRANLEAARKCEQALSDLCQRKLDEHEETLRAIAVEVDLIDDEILDAELQAARNGGTR